MLVTADNLPITERPQKNRLAAVLLYLAEREGFTRAIHGPRPAGSLAAVPNGNPAVWSNPKRSHQVGTLHQTQKNCSAPRICDNEPKKMKQSAANYVFS